MPAAIAMPLRLTLPLLPSVAPTDAMSGAVYLEGRQGVRRITLAQAQQLAVAAADPLVRLGQLQVEAAKQHRLGVKAQYFPTVSGQFENLHLNERPGEVLTVQRPFSGAVLSVPVNIVAQNQTAVGFSVVQPITPLFAVRELVKIARADENIAKSKAGMPVAELASLVEKNYFDLLVAERELVSAGAAARRVQAKWATVSTATRSVSTGEQTETIVAGKSWLLAASRVRALTASLTDMFGLPADTRLELVPPEPLVEYLSLDNATVGAAAVNAQIVEAEQTAVKAHAGSTLAKMAYAPIVAIVGGYAYQTALNDAILPQNFAYVGVVATYNLFDSGKRERGVKELSAQVQAAEIGVQLTKAKVSAEVKASYFELERTRQLVQLSRRLVSTPRVVNASYVSDNPEGDSERAQMEAELFRAELEYRQAYAHVKSLIGDK